MKILKKINNMIYQFINKKMNKFLKDIINAKVINKNIKLYKKYCKQKLKINY